MNTRNYFIRTVLDSLGKTSRESYEEIFRPSFVLSSIMEKKMFAEMIIVANADFKISKQFEGWPICNYVELFNISYTVV